MLDVYDVWGEDTLRLGHAGHRMQWHHALKHQHASAEAGLVCLSVNREN